MNIDRESERYRLSICVSSKAQDIAIFDPLARALGLFGPTFISYMTIEGILKHNPVRKYQSISDKSQFMTWLNKVDLAECAEIRRFSINGWYVDYVNGLIQQAVALITGEIFSARRNAS